jgi:hypothetical protein
VPFSVSGAPLALKEGDDWAITASALTSKLTQAPAAPQT